MHAQTKFKYISNGIKTRLYDGYPYLYMQFSKEVQFVPTPDWYYNVEYLEEQRRGYEFKEDLFVPGSFKLTARKGESIIFSASTSDANPLTLKRKYTAEFNKRIIRDSFKNCLINAAQQFIVRKERKTEIISGFHWFNTSSRDTFISLPGLTLPTKDKKTFKAVADSMVSKMNNGLFPDIGPDDGMEYNSVDASLWFIWALQQYCIRTNDRGFVWKNYSKAIKTILRKYKDGTLHNIRMMDNGLIYAGEQGVELTWMNAVVEGKPVTPRTGCAVEVNALWYNAIVFSIELANKANDQTFVKKWESLVSKIRCSFLNAFWDEEKKYLADYVNGELKDWRVRPNQVIATSVPNSPLTDEMSKSILEVVRKDLLTPRGLRTLAPRNPDYKGKYEGDQEKRDLAYHQGTVWPWLIGHFCEGYLKLYKKAGLSFVKTIIKDFEPTMSEHGIGTISEIYDGDPPHSPNGAISSAKSVAALLTIFDRAEEMESYDK